MKKLIILLFVVFTTLVYSKEFTVNKTIDYSVEYSDYCDGWKAGYKAGYCYQQVYCLEPLPPLCPLPQISRNSYEDGYNDGFVKGRRDKR
jgi:hypothetical protein